MTHEEQEQYFRDELEKLSQQQDAIIKQRNEYRKSRLRDRAAEEKRKIAEWKKQLSSEHGIPQDAKFEKAWAISWDQGHSNGLDEVRSIFADLAELIKLTP